MKQLSKPHYHEPGCTYIVICCTCCDQPIQDLISWLGDYDAISNKKGSHVVGHNSITIMYIIYGSLWSQVTKLSVKHNHTHNNSLLVRQIASQYGNRNCLLRYSEQDQTSMKDGLETLKYVLSMQGHSYEFYDLYWKKPYTMLQLV